MYLLLHLEEAYSPLTSPMETMVPLVPQRLLLLLLLQSLLLKLLLKILLLLLKMKWIQELKIKQHQGKLEFCQNGRLVSMCKPSGWARAGCTRESSNESTNQGLQKSGCMWFAQNLCKCTKFMHLHKFCALQQILCNMACVLVMMGGLQVHKSGRVHIPRPL